MLNFNDIIQIAYVLTAQLNIVEIVEYLKGPCFHKRRWGRKRILDEFAL